MIGRQFGVLPSQPPNWMVTDPSASFFAVMLLSVYASNVFFAKKPSALYTLIDQKPSTGHVLHVEPVDRRAIVLGRRDIEIDGILLGIEAPARGGDDQVPDRIDLTLRAGGVVPVRQALAQAP